MQPNVVAVGAKLGARTAVDAVDGAWRSTDQKVGVRVPPGVLAILLREWMVPFGVTALCENVCLRESVATPKATRCPLTAGSDAGWAHLPPGKDVRVRRRPPSDGGAALGAKLGAVRSGWPWTRLGDLRIRRLEVSSPSGRAHETGSSDLLMVGSLWPRCGFHIQVRP